jgi:Protein of unknown function (DUF1761)
MKTNYWAVLVCAVVYWLMGAVWYDLLFQKPWLSLEHLTLADAAQMSPVWPYIITLVLNLLIAFVLAQICVWRNANTAGRGAAIGTLLWIGFVGPIAYTTNMYELRPAELFAINYCYPLAGLAVMGAILGVWHRKAA